MQIASRVGAARGDLRRVRRLVVLLGASGCWIHAGANVRGDADGVTGGALVAEGAVAHLRAGVDLAYDTVEGDDERGALGSDAFVRFGAITYLRGLKVPSWFDLGPAAGIGYGADGDLDVFGHAWLGIWTDVRLAPTRSYPVLRVELQGDVYTGDLRGGPQVVVGLGWVYEDENVHLWGD